MQKVHIVFILLLLSSLAIFADERANFQGEWSFNKSKSEFGQGGDRFVPIKLRVEHNDSIMTIERTFQREYNDDFVDTMTFTLDGSENHSEFWNSPRVISAHWSEDGQALTINTRITFTWEDEPSTVRSTDTWQLDGDMLSREFAVDGRMGRLEAIYVFSRTN